MKKLRIIRILLAAVTFAVSWCAVWFIPKTAPFFTTQFGSSALEVLSEISLGAVFAVVSITIITLLAGRVYCSVLCPLGIMQDIMAAGKRKYRFLPRTRPVKYLIFIIFAAMIATTFMLPWTILMPSAHFVQIVNYGFREVCFRMGISETSSNAAVTTMITAWTVFIILLILARWKGRIYCNSLCPVGTILGVFARFALYRVKIDKDKCVSCGACEKICKSSCIDAKNKLVNNEDCVMCMNCLSQCKFDALKITACQNKEPSMPSRREFIAGSAALAGGVAAGIVLGKTPVPDKKVIMPPGAMDFDRFSSACIGCGLCISACSGDILTPSVTAYGLRGFMMPHIDYSKGECRFSCNRCMTICPCGALKPLELKEKQSLRIGIARYTPALCVAYDAGEDCGACAEHCPVGALTMVPYKDTTIPQVNDKLCIGCGACQHICPVMPIKAITIEGIPNQSFVEKPEAAEAVKLDAEEDFPF